MKKTKHNILIYYLEWLSFNIEECIEINDFDKNTFMALIHDMSKVLGLDLILYVLGY